ncbi:cheA signal transduction histidine kinase [Thiohalobacter thiocyanaticus]|uniref:Chemotaxis protein CheA n=1 Tax=Thiohalobacter thiocyanaticus TaxID=585455 RepID=A0A1Z4VQZ0_9GAMM|nr:chemotaxis protein CheA [Thiohalobacter thiocyanaticus]BAZ93895.1 cheA signal transduction histidine kinase [Thiohalobacter thiocyanaticus]
MSLDPNDDILQDFLVEAGELLEQLNEQLIQLERSPQDKDLLNAVFRSFHTIKGGASFLGLDNLVTICHTSEDVFNILRNGERIADATLMDAVLKAVDVVNGMFAEIQGGEEPGAADPALVTLLNSYAKPQSEDAAPSTPAAPAGVSDAGGDAADDEFEAMLDAARAGSEAGSDTTAAAEPAAGEQTAGGDEISEEEFEALLDQLHGAKGAPGKGESQAPAAPPAAAASADGEAAPAGGGELITDDEFEALLDQLHGQGAAPAGGGDAAVASAPAAAAPAAKQERPAPAAKAEERSAPAKAPAPQAETSVRVDTRRLDEIMNLVGELVLVRNRLATLKQNLGQEKAASNEEISKAVANLDVVTADLQTSVMKTRMQPIKKVFGRFPRVVRDLARAMEKEINLEMQGEETDLDKNLVEALADPLVHLVRNAVDHGIESPEEREAAGKPRAGTVILAAEQEGDHILLSIEDDGKGMDPDALRRKAVEKGLMDEEAAARLDDHEAYNLIFAPGFSTKTEISDISGRGVGMDVVKTRIGQLNGSVEIDSRLGRGSRLSIRVPLTLAIMPTLMVVLGDQPFALPLASVIEIFDLDIKQTNVVDGQLVVRMREKAIPLFYLRTWLVKDCYSLSEEEKGQGHVVLVNVGSQRVGFVVDELIGQEEVVIKPLTAMLNGMPGFAGATITGDGRIALILDVPSLMRKYASRF